MTRTGPPKKPTSLKLIQGTFRKDRVSVNEPRPKTAIPPVPEHLSDEAKAEYARVSQDLAQLGLLSRIDRAALAAYCECWADWVEATRFCSTTADGQSRKVVKTAAGNIVENPYFSIKKRSAELMHKFLTEFGMTPASRTSINALPLPADETLGNPFANLG